MSGEHEKLPAEHALEDAINTLSNTSERLLKIQRQIARKIERTLQKYAGHKFDTTEAKKIFADEVNTLLRKNNVRLKCPTCEAPSILFLQTAGTTRTGSFQHQHFKDGKKTRHGGSTIVPTLNVVSLAAVENSGKR